MINSCGKGKLNSHDKLPSCQDLNSYSKRQDIKLKYSSISVPAGELYTGNQAKRVREAVKLLRKTHKVDYYIISAGFGLVGENDLIPPYECTFSGKGKRAISEMADELGIASTITDIPAGYDLTFLVLGKNYLHALHGLEMIQSKAKETVVFDKIKSEDGLIVIDPNYLASLGNDRFEVPLGNHLINKASILLNFAKYLEYSNDSFSSWWNQYTDPISGIHQKDTILQKNAIHFEIPVKSINKGKLIKSINMSSEIGEGSREEIEAFVRKFTKNDIVMLTELLQGLNTVNTKRGQTRTEWVIKHDDKIDSAKYFYNKIYTFIDDLNQDKKEAKAKIKKYLVNLIRKRQEELGYEKSLLNNPRMAIIKTLINWYENPELQKVESVYIPRSEKSMRRRNKSLQPPQLLVTLNNIRESDNHFEMILNLSNSSPYPLQNVVISLETQENFKLSIYQASGKLLELVNDDINIAFIPSSMDGEQHVEKIRVISYSILDEDDKLVVKVKQDFSAENTVVTATYEFDLE